MQVLGFLLGLASLTAAQVTPRFKNVELKNLEIKNVDFKKLGFRNIRTPLMSSATTRDRSFISIPIVLLPDGGQSATIKPKNVNYQYVGRQRQTSQRLNNQRNVKLPGHLHGKSASTYQIVVPPPPSVSKKFTKSNKKERAPRNYVPLAKTSVPSTTNKLMRGVTQLPLQTRQPKLLKNHPQYIQVHNLQQPQYLKALRNVALNQPSQQQQQQQHQQQQQSQSVPKQTVETVKYVSQAGASVPPQQQISNSQMPQQVHNQPQEANYQVQQNFPVKTHPTQRPSVLVTQPYNQPTPQTQISYTPSPIYNQQPVTTYPPQQSTGYTVTPQQQTVNQHGNIPNYQSSNRVPTQQGSQQYNTHAVHQSQTSNSRPPMNQVFPQNNNAAPQMHHNIPQQNYAPQQIPFPAVHVPVGNIGPQAMNYNIAPPPLPQSHSHPQVQIQLPPQPQIPVQPQSHGQAQSFSQGQAQTHSQSQIQVQQPPASGGYVSSHEQPSYPTANQGNFAIETQGGHVTFPGSVQSSPQNYAVAQSAPNYPAQNTHHNSQISNYQPPPQVNQPPQQTQIKYTPPPPVMAQHSPIQESFSIGQNNHNQFQNSIQNAYSIHPQMLEIQSDFEYPNDFEYAVDDEPIIITQEDQARFQDQDSHGNIAGSGGQLIYASSSAAKQINYSPSPNFQSPSHQDSYTSTSLQSSPTYVSFATAGMNFKGESQQNFDNYDRPSGIITPGSSYSKQSESNSNMNSKLAEFEKEAEAAEALAEEFEEEEAEADDEEASYKVVYIPLDILKTILSNSVDLKK